MKVTETTNKKTGNKELKFYCNITKQWEILEIKKIKK